MKYLNASQAAKRIGISDKTIRRWLKEGKISAIRISSNQLAIPESEVEALRLQRAQFIQEEEKQETPSHDQAGIEALAAKVTELEQKIATLEGKTITPSVEKAIEPPISTPAHPARVVAEKAPKRAYKAKDTTLPDGCILASEFAVNHGVARPTFIDHMTKGLGAGLIGTHTNTIPERDRVDYSERVKPNRPKETEKYLTQEQQYGALEFWKRHDVSFAECNDIGCWCHTVLKETE